MHDLSCHPILPLSAWQPLFNDITGCFCVTDLCNEVEYNTLLYTSSSHYAISGVMLLIVMIILVIGLILLHFMVRHSWTLTVMNIAINIVNKMKFNRRTLIRVQQEAQLPQRNSASAAHMDGGGKVWPSSPLPLHPSGYTCAYGRIRKPQHSILITSNITSSPPWLSYTHILSIITLWGHFL